MIARQDLGPAVAVDIEARHALGILARALAGGAGEDLLGRPFVEPRGSGGFRRRKACWPPGSSTRAAACPVPLKSAKHWSWCCVLPDFLMVCRSQGTSGFQSLPGFRHHQTQWLCQSPPKTRSGQPSPSMSATAPPASMVRNSGSMTSGPIPWQGRSQTRAGPHAGIPAQTRCDRCDPGRPPGRGLLSRLARNRQITGTCRQVSPAGRLCEQRRTEGQAEQSGSEGINHKRSHGDLSAIRSTATHEAPLG